MHLFQRKEERPPFVKMSVIGWIHKKQEFVGQISNGHAIKKKIMFT
jgi:hypothetical protein